MLFQEREENVKVDIFAAYISLVKHTRNVSTSSAGKSASDEDVDMETEDNLLSLLAGQVPSIIKGEECKIVGTSWLAYL